MALDLRLQHKLAPQLVMTPQLQQAIGLLQLSHLEMAAALRQEIAENPVFDDASPAREPQAEGTDGPPSPGEGLRATATPTGDSWGSLREGLGRRPAPSALDDWGGPETLPASAPSLAEHLHWQLQMANLAPPLLQVAQVLVEEIGPDGYLTPSWLASVTAACEVDETVAHAALAIVQDLEPVGVAARDLRECLQLQARALEHPSPLVLSIIEHHLPAMERQSLRDFSRLLRAKPADVALAVTTIRTLEPRPGRAFHTERPAYIVPDLYVEPGSEEGTFAIHINEDSLPPLIISPLYRADNTAHYDAAAKAYLQDKLRHANWLIRSVAMRHRTMLKVMQSICRFQSPFFEEGPEALMPLTLREVAADVGMHESTISRTTSNKYVHTPQGIFELKYFFNSTIRGCRGTNVASANVRSRIAHLIAQENKDAPLSDQKIVDSLKAQDITIARRTVAKYRKMLRKNGASSRRRSL